MGVTGDKVTKTLYFHKKITLTPHKLCEFLDFFKKNFERAYYDQNE